MSTIFHSTDKGYITLERTGKSESYVVWLIEATAAKRIATIGARLPYALTRAIAKLEDHH